MSERYVIEPSRDHPQRWLVRDTVSCAYIGRPKAHERALREARARNAMYEAACRTREAAG